MVRKLYLKSKKEKVQKNIFIGRIKESERNTKSKNDTKRIFKK
jgi:hypothetical protein